MSRVLRFVPNRTQLPSAEIVPSYFDFSVVPNADQQKLFIYTLKTETYILPIIKDSFKPKMSDDVIKKNYPSETKIFHEKQNVWSIVVPRILRDEDEQDALIKKLKNEGIEIIKFSG